MSRWERSHRINVSVINVFVSVFLLEKSSVGKLQKDPRYIWAFAACVFEEKFWISSEHRGFSVFGDVHWSLPWPRESTPTWNVFRRTFYSASVWFDLIHFNHWIDWKKVGEQHGGVYRCVIGLWRVLAWPDQNDQHLWISLHVLLRAGRLYLHKRYLSCQRLINNMHIKLR